jgi:hypothetical protein
MNMQRHPSPECKAVPASLRSQVSMQPGANAMLSRAQLPVADNCYLADSQENTPTHLALAVILMVGTCTKTCPPQSQGHSLTKNLHN